MYLTSTFIAVISANKNTPCVTGRSLVVNAPFGYISPTTALSNDWGSRDCPWSLQAKPGQRLKLTIIELKTAVVGRSVGSSSLNG